MSAKHGRTSKTGSVEGDLESEGSTADDRLARLLTRLLAGMDAAAATGAWDRVTEMGEDVLAVDPDNQRAKALVERAQAEQPLPEGQRAFVSLIFSDIVRSTNLAEKSEPEVVRAVFNLYRQAATEAVHEMDGRILQFQGDGVVACFGYPNVHEDDARRAVMAGLGLVERMAEGRTELRRRYGVETEIRVGVHSGTMVVTGLASGAVDASDLVGAAANLTARLQSEAEPGTVVISSATKHLVEAHFEVVSLGMRSLTGFSRPVEVFHVLRPSHRGSRSDPGHGPAVPLIGRVEQSDELQSTWDELLEAAARGRPPDRVVATVRGPAGIGKSRLAAELEERVRAEGHAVMEASCSPYHTNVALWPIGRMIEQLVGLYPGQPAHERLTEVTGRLEAAGLNPFDVVPLLAPLLGLDVDERWSPPELDGPALRAETLKALVDWLAHFARATPSLLLVEDLHWADPTTVDLLGMMIGERAPGVMVLVTSRQPVAAEWSAGAVDIELGPLDTDEASTLVAAVASDAGLDPAQRRLITERGAGVPLFLQELARSAVAATPGEVLPPRLHELLTARLRAPGLDLRVAQLAATLGAVFDERQLAELAGAPVTGALAQLEGADIIEPVGDARQAVYRFRHVLMRDAAYETQVLESRRSTHNRIAELLQSVANSPGDLAVVAQHHDLAGDPAQAIPAHIAAAQAAQAAASHSEARRLLDRTLELLATLPEEDERDLTELMVRMLRTISVSSLFGYGYPDVFEDFQLADRICRRLTDRTEIMPAQVGIWSYMLVRGDVDGAATVLAPLTNLLDAPETAWFTPEIKSCLGYNAFYRGRLDEARHWLEEAWAGYLDRPTDATASPFWPLPHDPVPVTAVALACVLGLQGDTAESLEWELRALAAAEQLVFPFGPFSSAFILTYLAWLRMITGDAAGARQFGRRTLAIAEQCRFDYFSVIGRQYVLVPEPGRPGDADELEQCGAGMELIGHGAFRPAFLGIVARSHSYAGNLDRALERVGDALLGVQKSGEWVHQPDLLRLRAEITAATHPERMDDVAADLTAAVEVGLKQGSLVLALRAANGVARLPGEVRRPDWRDVVLSVVDRYPPSSTSAELAEARAILGA